MTPRYVFLVFFALLMLTGCHNTYAPLGVTTGTHKVWLGPNYLSYDREDGLACGHIERINGGWVYEAGVIDWDVTHRDSSLSSMWNSFTDAQNWVERWCKP